MKTAWPLRNPAACSLKPGSTQEHWEIKCDWCCCWNVKRTLDPVDSPLVCLEMTSFRASLGKCRLSLNWAVVWKRLGLQVKKREGDWKWKLPIPSERTVTEQRKILQRHKAALLRQVQEMTDHQSMNHIISYHIEKAFGTTLKGWHWWSSSSLWWPSLIIQVH